MVRFSRERLFALVFVLCCNWTGLDGDSKRKTGIERTRLGGLL